MSEEMQSLIEDDDTTEAIAKAWPKIKSVLVEQQLILVSAGEDDGSKKLKGFAVAYRALEKFKDAAMSKSKK